MAGSPWWAGPMLAFDTETTGINPETDRIVSATTIRISPGRPTVAFRRLIAVDVDIPQAAIDVHGITTEHARAHGQPEAHVVDQVAQDLTEALTAGVPVVAFNAAYDLTILDRALRRLGTPAVEQRIGRRVAPVIDAMVLDKHVSHRRGKRQLHDVAAFWRVPHEHAHDDMSDALAAARVAWRIGRIADADETAWQQAGFTRREQEALRMLAGLDLRSLHLSQIAWRAQQCDSLRAYFDRQNITHDGVPGAWPIHPYPTATTTGEAPANRHGQEALVP